MLTVDELLQAIESKNSYPFDEKQRDAIVHGDGPLWIVAGPGTGKTEVIVVKVLKLLCCDGLEPQSIVVTTFTEKAALNLENRIADGMLFLAEKYPQIAEIDYCQLKIGTLHSLCSDVMQEYRYKPYQNVRLMDNVEQAMFIERYVARFARENCSRIQSHFFPLLVDGRFHHSDRLWIWTKVLCTLFDRIVDDDIDVEAMRSAGGVWQDLANAYNFYVTKLTEQHSCDFSHLQKHFYAFLHTGFGDEFLQGTGHVSDIPIRAVLVDEYQDTNPIQERIYFMLASNEPHNICVVGDDDQALYRFRGGTVDCMINFNERCVSHFGIAPTTVNLCINYRSNKVIVDWCNEYISSFDVMKKAGARIEGKPPACAVPEKTGFSNAVGLIRDTKVERVANEFACVLKELMEHCIIEDYSQCVLILPSTKDTKNAAGQYLSALAVQEIPVYNPRAKDFLDHNEVGELLGAFISIIDPDLSAANATNLGEIISLASSWVDDFHSCASRYSKLRDYVATSASVILNNKNPKEHFAEYAAGVLYRILSFEPFPTYQMSPDRDMRLSKITRIFEAFTSMRDRPLKADSDNPSRIDRWWLSGFYMSLCGYLAQYGMDDDEDDEVICPKGFLPIMTIHQSKGLEFDFVFAANLGRKVAPDAAHTLEQEYAKFRKNPVTLQFEADELAWQDEIRKSFVTYSRAKHALILLATDSQLRKSISETASFSQYGGVWFRNNHPLI